MTDITIHIPDELCLAVAATQEERVEFARQAFALSCLQVKQWSKEDCSALLGITLQEFDQILIARGLNLSAPSHTHADKPVDEIFFDHVNITPETKKVVGQVLIDALNEYFRASCKGFSSFSDIGSFRFRLHKVLKPFSPKIDYQSMLEMREVSLQASERLFREGRDKDAIIWRELSEHLRFEPEYFMTEEEIAARNRSSKKLGTEEVFSFIADIESARIAIEPHVRPEEVWSGEVRYKASNGWQLILYIRGGRWRYIKAIIMDPSRRSSETELFYEDFAVSMPDLIEYHPSDQVRWNIYRLPKLVTRTCDGCGFFFTANVEDKTTTCEDCIKRDREKEEK